MDESYRIRPPGGVRFAGWIIGIGAFLLCAIGALLVFVDPSPAALEEAGITRGILQVVGFVMLTIGMLEFLLIYALWDGSNVARIITTVLVGLSVVGGLVQTITDAPGAIVSLIQMIIGLFIIAFLWGSPSATEFFARPEEGTSYPVAPPPVP